MPNKRNGKTIGLYTNYQNGVNGDYDVLVCSEVSSSADIPAGIEIMKIPAGKYAKFITINKKTPTSTLHISRKRERRWNTSLWKDSKLC